MALSDLKNKVTSKLPSKSNQGSVTRGITSKVGEVDTTALENAKTQYSNYNFAGQDDWDQGSLPSYLKRIQYWDTFIKGERAKDEVREKKLQKILELSGNAKGNPEVLPKDSPERHIYMLLEQTYGKNKLLSSVDEAAENAIKENLAKNIDKKGICDKLFEDLTTLIVTEARSNLNAIGGALNAAENSLISMVGTYVDGKLQPITQGIKDFYNGARNFVMDTIESALEGLLSGARDLMGLDYAKANTVLSAAAQEAIAKVDLLAGYPIQANPTPTKTPGKGVDASYYITNPLEDRKLTPENIAAIKDKLQEEANSVVNHLFDVLGTSMFQNSLKSQETTDYVVMSLMDAAKNRIHVFNYMTDILGYNDTTNKLMNFADSLRPSNIIGSLLYDNPWGEQNTAAQEAIGSVQKLMSFNNSDSMDSFIKKVGGSLLGLTGKEKEEVTVKSIMDKNIKTLPYNPNIIKAGTSDTEMLSMTRNVFGSMADAFVKSRTSSSGHVTVGLPDNKLNPNPKKNTEIDKLYRAICNIFAINDKDEADEPNSLAPSPLWGNMRNPAADGRGDVYGLGSLVKSFRINKYIPSGEVDYFQNGFSHIFFVKPDLNLTQNAVAAMDMTGNPMLGDIITNLNYDNNELLPYWNDFPAIAADYSRSNSFISYLLSNMMENLPVTDLTLDTKDAYENLKGFRMPYGLTHYKNTWAGEISLAFKDTKTLLINNIIQTWVKYISIMKEGIAECAPKRHNYGYLDYAGAIYGFITEPDGQTITHWFRYTGVFPTTVPLSTISTSRQSQDIPEFSVNFKYAFYESNDVNILKDFNFIMNNGRRASKTGAASAFEQYAMLGALPEIKAFTPLSDITLKTGAFPNENHAFVGILFPDQINNFQDTISHISSTVMASNNYRFILRYDSSSNFQGNLIGEVDTNDNLAEFNFTGIDAAKAVQQQKVNQAYSYDAYGTSNTQSSSSSTGPLVFR